MGGPAPLARRALTAFVVALGAAVALVMLAAAYRAAPAPAFGMLVLLTALPAATYVAWHAHPAVLLSAGIVLSIFSGNWAFIGFPNLIAPDRLLIVAAVVSTLLRAPQVRDRARIELRPIHWLLAITTAYVIASALAAGTFGDKDALLRLADRVGVVPFVLFAIAPVVFPDARSRAVLLGSLVGVGLYLAVMAFFTTLGLSQLVVPGYISDLSIGIHRDRARGPFLEAVGNGTGIYIGLVASVIAAATWKVRWQRNVAIVTAVLCAASLLFTLTRSVWLGATLATAVALLAHPALRRWLVPVAVGVALVTATSIAAIPGLATKVETREGSQGPIWDRYNLGRAALNMAEERPLFGFGWDRFPEVGTDYFELGDYPLTVDANVGIHSAYLSHLAELGLVGTSLWLLSTLLAVWLALKRRGPPELEPWRYGLLAIAVMFFVVSAFVYPYLFAVVVLWAWAGILYGSPEARTEPG
jgi:putative inorganic carbon (hco3(-)) transporter